MMAHGSFKVVDSDMHVIEPPDLWQRYIDPAFREKSPYGTNAAPRDISCYIGNRSAYRTDAIRTWVGPIVSHTAPLEKDY
jgi:hypothetical protein